MGGNHTEALQRWEDSGAVWRAVHVSDAKAIVDLCTCTGEPVDRIESSDPDLIRLLRRRPSGEDGWSGLGRGRRPTRIQDGYRTGSTSPPPAPGDDHVKRVSSPRGA